MRFRAEMRRQRSRFWHFVAQTIIRFWVVQVRVESRERRNEDLSINPKRMCQTCVRHAIHTVPVLTFRSLWTMRCDGDDSAVLLSFGVRRWPWWFCCILFRMCLLDLSFCWCNVIDKKNPALYSLRYAMTNQSTQVCVVDPDPDESSSTSSTTVDRLQQLFFRHPTRNTKKWVQVKTSCVCITLYEMNYETTTHQNAHKNNDIRRYLVPCVTPASERNHILMSSCLVVHFI